MTHRGERLRVCYFVPPSPHFAGVERVVHEIASGLAHAHGDELEVHVIFSTRYDEDMLRATPYTLHTLDVDRLRGLPRALRAVVARERFDVFVCPQVEPSVMAWASIQGLGVGAFVTHLHGNPRLEEVDGSRATRASSFVFRHLLSSRIAAVLSVAPRLRDYAAASLAPGAANYFAPNPARKLPPQQVTARTEVFRMLNIGRLSRQKGQDVLLRAFALARPRLPATTLTIVGAGEDDEQLRGLAEQLGIADDVTFTGYTTDPSTALAAADCFVLSSRWEGFPLVLLEALSSGLPVLATDCEFGPADLINDHRLGRLVPRDDPSALAEAMVAESHRELEDEHVVYRRSVASRYDPAAVSEEHFGLLKRILSTRRGKSPRGRPTPRPTRSRYTRRSIALSRSVDGDVASTPATTQTAPLR